MLRKGRNIAFWLKQTSSRPKSTSAPPPKPDIQLPTPLKIGLPHHAGSDERAVKRRVEASPSIGGYSGPSEGRDARPGEGVSREWASQGLTDPADLAAASRCSGVKSGSGFDCILNIGVPLGVSKLAQFRTRPRIARPPGLPKGDTSSQTSNSAPLWPWSHKSVAIL